VRSEKHEKFTAMPNFSALTSLFSPQVAGDFSNLLNEEYTDFHMSWRADLVGHQIDR
jgi:glutamate-1-semialdehyde aminotransferase